MEGHVVSMGLCLIATTRYSSFPDLICRSSSSSCRICQPFPLHQSTARSHLFRGVPFVYHLRRIGGRPVCENRYETVHVSWGWCPAILLHWLVRQCHMCHLKRHRHNEYAALAKEKVVDRKEDDPCGNLPHPTSPALTSSRKSNLPVQVMTPSIKCLHHRTVNGRVKSRELFSKGHMSFTCQRR